MCLHFFFFFSKTKTLGFNKEYFLDHVVTWEEACYFN
uniref:Uncharacterized protein n=1 Tax=Anguilla anguilla TaxID=7936 RepID=A0A0E9UKZ8_ANGAN